MKNLLVNGHEIAPDCCIVCGKIKPIRDSEKTWAYLAGARPPGGMTCSEKCLKVAIKRHNDTGRIDTPAMRMYS